ncbi:MAG: sulfatase-like hydrolase/transferase [Verrucomicrobiales bacterium]
MRVCHLAVFLLGGILQLPAAEPGPACNLVFISMTNTRADHLGVYGYQRNTSPHIDQFAKKSVVFKNIFSHASWTLPASISLFTSLYPFTHRLLNREDFQPLAPGIPTFVDVLKQHGYVSAAFVGNRDYSPKFGHTSRFDHTAEAVMQGEQEDWKTYGVFENTMPLARDWLRQNRDKKFFLLVQGYDTHCPFAAPKENRQFDPGYRGKIDFSTCYWTFERTRPIKKRAESGEYVDIFPLKTRPAPGRDNFEVMFYPEDVRHMIALYDGEIFNADQWVGKLLDDLISLDLERKTVVVIYSDHGDMFGKHGRFMRGGPLRGTFYDDVLHVPLIIRHPDIAPQSVEGLGQIIDIAPTLLDFLGQPNPSEFRGKSLRPLLSKTGPGTQQVAEGAVNSHVYAGAAFYPSDRNPFFRHDSIIVAVRNEKWKLIAERLVLPDGPSDSFELYDLGKDSEELSNVAAQQFEVLGELKGRLRDWLRDLGSESVLPGL